jgi:1,5-anhydro-D-fructose reductase (1,5-anhydro-D-mannitol-forming)
LSERIGVAMLSFAHVHAPDYAYQIERDADAELVAVWDEEPARGRPEAERRGVRFTEDLNTLLAMERVQGVVVCAPTAQHHRLYLAAADAGKHIFTEKAFTLTTQEATEAVAAIRQAGVKFMISLPSRVRREILFAKQVVESGALGEITLVRGRVGHAGALERWFRAGEGHSGSLWFGDAAQAGGGAFVDIGCHRADILRWLLGPPKSVIAHSLNFSGAYGVDDQTTAVIEFQNRATGILDVSWVHHSGPRPLEIYGTKGAYLLGTGPDLPMWREKIRRGWNRLRREFDIGPGAPVWMESERPDLRGNISPRRMPPAPPMPMTQWLRAIRHDTPMTLTLEDAWNLTHLLEGCIFAARTRCEHVFQQISTQ